MTEAFHAARALVGVAPAASRDHLETAVFWAPILFVAVVFAITYAVIKSTRS